MAPYFYKSEAPAVVALVSDWFKQKAAFDAQREQLGKVFGAAASPMTSGDTHYVGGVKLSASRELDVHWRRPDDYGYRCLRHKAVPPKGTSKEDRAAMRAEHERLQALWEQHCPKRISSHETWQQLNVNTGNLWLCGGVMFELRGTAYFALGFPINKPEHQDNVAAGKPTAGWIEGAVEILPSEYESARVLKVEGKKEVASA